MLNSTDGKVMFGSWRRSPVPRKMFSGFYVLMRCDEDAPVEAILPTELVGAAKQTLGKLGDGERRELSREWSLLHINGYLIVGFTPPGGMDPEEIQATTSQYGEFGKSCWPTPWYNDGVSLEALLRVVSRANA